MTRARSIVLAGVALSACAALAACSSDSSTSESSGGPSAQPSESVRSSSPAASTSASIAEVYPFTGRPAEPARPVLVVKIDNTGAAQPHVGLREADIVYIEEVEWGLTRLAAVYSSRLPESVGPVRSARISDIDILAAFGRPAFAYSGAQSLLRPVLAEADFYDVSGWADGEGYYRVPDRPAPVDYLARPKVLLDRAPDASTARDIGLTFAKQPPGGGRAATSATAVWPASSVEFRWNGAEWDVWFDGEPAGAAEGGGQQAATVVMQYVKQTDSGYGDRYGGRTPLVETVGSGRAVVLRDGRAWETTWARPSADEGTTFTLANGELMPFAPGQQWIVLVDAERGAQVR